MHFDEFVRHFGRRADKLRAVAPPGPALDLHPQEVAGYVPPTVTVEDWPTGAAIVLIEAPGAVGKSAAAAAFAERLNWPLVRAERAQVGSYSLSGIVQDALGFSSTFLAEVSSGRAGLVIDSLDEAHFKAGTENFLAFLENVGRIAGARDAEDGSPPGIILMSRSDTAELVKLVLADSEIPLATARLDFFDQTGSQRFIGAYLAQRFRETKRGEYNVPLASQRPFERLRDQRFRQIARVLTAKTDIDLRTDWGMVSDFLGYSPVLIAMAESLAVRNPASQSAELAARDQTDLLKEIIDSIAVREQEKLADHLTPKLTTLLPASNDTDMTEVDFYSPVEQCARLLAYVQGTELSVTLPASMPSAVRPVYEEAVRSFLPDHPFLKSRQFASVVFGDHVLAVACQDPSIRAALPFKPESVVEAAGPFFGRFLAGGGSGGQTVAEIDEVLIDHVISSWNQESDLVDAVHSEVRVTLMDEGSTVVCSRDLRGKTKAVADLEFKVTNVSGVWQIKRSLRRTSLITDQAVVLGEPGKSFTVGPWTLLAAEEVVIDAETLRVETDRGRSRGAFIAADVVTANHLAKVESGPDDLWLFCSAPPPRLRGFTRELQASGSTVPFQWFMDLRTVLLSFRPSTASDGTLAVHASKLEKKIVKDSEKRRRILHHLESTGIVSRQGALCHLSLPDLGRHGFGVQDLRTGEPGPAVLQFLHACITSSSE